MSKSIGGAFRFEPVPGQRSVGTLSVDMQATIPINDGQHRRADVVEAIRDLDPSRPTLVRMHRMSHFTDVFGELSGRSTLLSGAMEQIAEEGSGVVVLVNRPMQGDLLSRLVQARTGKSSPNWGFRK